MMIYFKFFSIFHTVHKQKDQSGFPLIDLFYIIINSSFSFIIMKNKKHIDKYNGFISLSQI